MSTVTSLWRYPIKSHGREMLSSVTLTAGQSMPWDRHWAVTHGDTKFAHADPAWVMCRNFMIGAITPTLAGISATLDEAAGRITLRHASIGDITFNPDTPADVARFIAWVTPLCPPDKRQPNGVVALPNRGLTDTDYPSISLMNTASHAAVEGRLGRPLERERWRGNIWLDGLAPWQEWEWIGKDIAIGDTILRIIEPIERCKHTTANTTTGVRDTDTLGLLRENWDHQDFGVSAQVIQGGAIATGDAAKVI